MFFHNVIFFQCLLSRRYGRHSFFLKDIVLEVSEGIYTTDNLFIELNNKLCSLNDVNSIYLLCIYWHIVLDSIYSVCNCLYANSFKILK